MKKTILLALIWTCCLAACNNKNDAAPEIQFNSGDSKVAYRKDTVIPASGSDLTINLKELVDSRCPANANCITMGSVAITFAVSDGTANALVNVTFKGDDKNSGVQTFSLGSKNYALKVTEVLPYPGTSKDPASLEDYNVGVSVVKI